jgi:hypothetical protein
MFGLKINWLLVYVWGDGERIKFFKLIKKGKREDQRPVYDNFRGYFVLWVARV